MITKAEIEITDDLIRAIREFPASRTLEHCGKSLQVSPLDIYAACPACGECVKLRSFSASPEIEDVFDAVIAWMDQPGANEWVERRQKELRDD